MKRILWLAVFAASIAWFASAAPAVSAAENSTAEDPAPPSASALVRQAIEAGLAGEESLRTELLTAAIAADPEYAPARWLSSQLKFDGRWRTVDEIAHRVANDSRWAEYQRLRQSLAGTPDDHAELARWCFRKGLANEERSHWAQVLKANPGHELARTRLGVREYRGGLCTEEQIADYEQRLSKAEQDFAQFAPKFTDLCRRALGPSADREGALDEISRIDDPAAIPALEYAVWQESENAADDLALKLQLAMVSAIANVRNHEATLKLLDYSVCSPTPEVRQRAAASLTSRPVTEYVPLLLGALTAPIQSEFETFVGPNGNMVSFEVLFQAGPENDRLLVRTREYQVAAQANALGRRQPISRGVEQNRQHTAAHAYQMRRQVAAANQEAEARNERIRETLRTSLQLDYGADPVDYWDEWTSYNEMYEEEHPVYEYYDYSSYGYTLAPPPMPRPPARKRSCFAAGTPVWTQTGPQAIETIVAGDMVLSQNPDTGELAFRPVQETTVRPPGRMARVNLGDETIATTLGHRFWVLGKGWEMAKHLDETWLHSLEGPKGVSVIEPMAPEAAYNLVVDDFHTYFVGDSRLLVHDNTCPRPTTAIAPGLPAKAAADEDPIAAGVVANAAAPAVNAAVK
jgi:hypothetical protein